MLHSRVFSAKFKVVWKRDATLSQVFDIISSQTKLNLRCKWRNKAFKIAHLNYHIKKLKTDSSDSSALSMFIWDTANF